ncbi:hypothetical protein MB831_04740 [Pasteurella multocida subsp. multocida]|uniref:hypothetical protein n=2 Tax=Pasteurellaceae TaxID=712 RepID=UPI00147FC4E8|nr:hypothetical protein [Pasteurella multocida]MCW4596781.1 hypothetical protein [Pasteurella multocida subsp. multocida]NNI67873.1 hypothetical protein [Pasteurella multocida]NNI70134.1 hypothetical protein [Pasteurella multocida]
MRKIIQICESASASHAFGDCWNLTALCDDGSVWVIDGICDFKGNPKEWKRLPDIPQDEPQTDTEQQPEPLVKVLPVIK